MFGGYLGALLLAAGYLAVGLWVLVIHASAIPAVLQLVVESAFSGHAAGGETRCSLDADGVEETLSTVTDSDGLYDFSGQGQ